MGAVVGAAPDHGVVERDRVRWIGSSERGEEQVRVRHVAELGGAADEEGLWRGEEQDMDLVDLPLACAVHEEDRDAV